jgi:hypothetical protein
MTTEGVKLLEGRVAEPKMKKPWIGESEEDKDTGEEEQTIMAWASKNSQNRVEE